MTRGIEYITATQAARIAQEVANDTLALMRENAVLREALDFYADSETYNPYSTSRRIYQDQGEMAREALALASALPV